jgi:glycosyltransferase involved in cell wall biosynthesis
VRILVYTHAFAPSIGGVESSVGVLAERLVAAGGGIDVTVATRTPAGESDDRRLSFRVMRRPGLGTLWKLIGEAEVVHLAGPVLFPMLLAWLRRKPVVVRHHGYQACCPNGLLFYEPTKTACPGHFMARRYDRCLVCNAATMGWGGSLRRILLTFPRRWLSRRAAANIHNARAVQDRLALPRSRVVHQGVVAGEEGGAGTSTPAGPPCFAYVGRLVSEKGLPLLVEAARRLRDRGERFTVKFIGDGPERARLTVMVEEHGLRPQVTFTGFLRGQRLLDELAGVTALVMPSVWEETAGLSAVEQMMRGRLVIASDIGGLGELVDGAGLKFAPGDVGALVGCMARVLSEPELAGRLGAVARVRARALFGAEVTLETHLAVFRRAMQGRPVG